MLWWRGCCSKCLTLTRTAAASALTLHNATPPHSLLLPRPVTVVILRSQSALLSWSAPQAHLNLVSYDLHVGVHVAIVLWQRLLVLFTIPLLLHELLFCSLRMRSEWSLVPMPLNLLLVGDGA